MSDVPDTEPTNPNPEPTEEEQARADVLEAMIAKVQATSEDDDTVRFTREEFNAWNNIESRDANQMREWCESRGMNYDEWAAATAHVENILVSD